MEETAVAGAVIDESDLIIQSWSRAWTWRSLPNVIVQAARFVWDASHRLTGLAVALGVVLAVTYVPILVVLQHGIQSVAQGGVQGTFSRTGLLALASLAGVLLLRGVASAVDRQVSWHLETRVFLHAERTVLDAAARVRLEAYEEPKFFNLLQRASMVEGQIAQSVPRVIGAMTDVAGVAAITVALSLFATPLLLVLAVGSALPAWISELWSAREWYKVESENAALSRMRYYIRNVFEDRRAAAEIRAFDIAGTLRKWSDDAWEAMHGPRARAYMRRGRREAASNLISAALIATGFGVALVSAKGGERQLASAAAAVIGLVQIRMEFAELFRKLSLVFDTSLYLSDLLKLDSWSHALTTVEPDDPAPAGPLRAIHVEGVSFRYPGGERNVLSDVSIAIGQGQLVALVGRNGSGKTTLAKIIAGLFTPTSGRVTWNGVPYHRIGSRVRRLITMHFQEPMRWAFTLRENIWLGDVWGSHEDGEAVDRAVQKADLTDLVRQLPNGLDTRLGKELGLGADLSGGEWQRVGLARCYFRDSDLIILDEPTTSLDAQAEADFLQALRALLRTRSALIISHRFSNLKIADWIYVLDGGRIIEAGTHDDLVRLEGTYARLYEQQVNNLV
jgi:ATP-binding cassette subfamily B protein